jgi:hypothetical protein
LGSLVAAARPMPTCRPGAGGGAGVDTTALGGPAAGCIDEAQAYVALVHAVGCLRDVEDWDEIPYAERRLLVSTLTPGLSLGPDGQTQSLLTGRRFTARAAQLARDLQEAREDAERFQRLLAGTLKMATRTVRINGLDYTPAGGSALLIVQPGIYAQRRTPYVIGTNIEVSAPTDVVRVKLRPASRMVLPVDQSGMQIGRIPIDTGVPFIPGTRLQGSVTTTLERHRSRIRAYMRLPDDFAWETGQGITAEVQLLASNRDGIRLDGFGIENVEAAILGVGVHIHYLRYVASLRQFQGSAKVSIPPAGAIEGTLHVRGDAIELLDITYFPMAPGIKVAPGVFLSEVNGFYEDSQQATRFGGNAAFTGGPSAGQGCGLVTARGGLDLRLRPSPITLTVEGQGSVVCIPLLRAKAVVAADGFVNVAAGIDYGLGPVSLKAGWDIKYRDLRFTAQADADGCVEDLGCAKGTALISDRGMAFCAEFGPVDAGAGLDWPAGPSLPAIIAELEIMFSGCDVGEWRTVAGRRAIAAQAGARTVTLGPRGGVVGVVGADGAPLVRLRGPGGQVVEVPEQGAIRNEQVLAFRQRATRTTYVAVAQGGAWTIEVLDGAAAEIRVADVLPEPRVTAEVTRRGSRYVARWRATPIPGQTVRLFERAPGGMRQLAELRGSAGVVRFTPSDASGSRRQLVALVEQHGQPRKELVLARFISGPPRIGRAGRVRARRAGRTLVVSFRPAANAEEHLVGVQLGDGRSLQVRAPRGARRVRVPAVTRRETVRLRIAGTRSAGTRTGPVARRRLRVR